MPTNCLSRFYSFVSLALGSQEEPRKENIFLFLGTGMMLMFFPPQDGAGMFRIYEKILFIN